MSKAIIDENSRMQKVITFILSIFYGFLVSLYLIFSILKNRSNYFYKKKRDVPPNCLTDPSLGVEHRFVKLKDIKLHYVCAGDPNNQLMVLIHGFPEFWFSWRHQIKEFSKDYFVVAIDMRGYGDSDKPNGIHNYTVDKIVDDIQQLLEALNRRNIILVGHDWGGVISWVFASTYSHFIDKLIILNSPHPLKFREVRKNSFRQFLMSWYMLFFSLPFFPEIALKSNDYFVLDYGFRKSNGKPLFSSEYLEAYKYTFHKNSFTYPLNYYRASVLGYPVVRPKSFQIKVPTLTIWAKDDAYLITELAQSFKYVDNLIIKYIENCSHWVQMDEPLIVNQHMRQFLS